MLILAFEVIVEPTMYTIFQILTYLCIGTSLFWQFFSIISEVLPIYKGAKLVGAVGTRAPTLFLPRPEFAPIWC